MLETDVVALGLLCFLSALGIVITFSSLERQLRRAPSVMGGVRRGLCLLVASLRRPDTGLLPASSGREAHGRPSQLPTICRKQECSVCAGAPA